MSASLTVPGDYAAWLADLNFVQRSAAQFGQQTADRCGPFYASAVSE